MAAGEAGNKATRRTNDVGPTGQTVAENIARLRNLQGLSTYRLSELLAELGRPIAPSAISRIESGQRKVDVDDLVVLAIALNVSPTALLLYPSADPDIGFDLAVGTHVTEAEAWSWILAERPLDLPPDDDGEAWNRFQTHSRPPGRRLYQSGQADLTVDIGGKPFVFEVKSSSSQHLSPAAQSRLEQALQTALEEQGRRRHGR